MFGINWKQYGMDDFRACFNLTCAILGIGSLSMARNYSQAGPVAASIAIGLMCAINTYSTVAVSKCMRAAPAHVQTFGDLGEYVGGKWGRMIVVITQFGTCLLVPVAYLVLCGSSLLPTIFRGAIDLTPNAWIPITALILLPVVLIRSLKDGAWVALLGAAGAFFGDFFAVVDSLAFAERLTLKTDVQAEPVLQVFGSLSLAYGAAVVIPSIQRDHGRPENLPVVITASVILITIIYFLIGILGFYQYGCQSPGNLLSSMENRTLELLAYIWFLIALVISFAVLLNPALYLFERNVLGFYQVERNNKLDDEFLDYETPKMDNKTITRDNSQASLHYRGSGVSSTYYERVSATKEYMEGKHSVCARAAGELAIVENEEAPFTMKQRLQSYCLRTFVVAIQTFLAMLLQSVFNDLADFIGATTITMSCIVIPVLMYLKFFNTKLSLLERCWCVFVIVLGLGLGLYSASKYVTNMVEAFKNIALFDQPPASTPADRMEYCIKP